MGKFDEEETGGLQPEDEAELLPAAFSEDALSVVWVTRHARRWRYVTQWGSWYEWQADHWHQERTAKVYDLARRITREALLWDGITAAARLRVNSSRTATALLQFVKSDRSVACGIDQWDKDAMLLGVPGGMVDLKACKLIYADPEKFITKRTAVAPKKGRPERWLQFLERVTNGNTTVRDYLHRFAGYALTGSTQEHALAFLYGTGANGKTTFVQTLLGVLGDYAITTPIETFAETKGERHPTELARLRGARLVATEETSAGSRWNESRIKTLTGGNRISARFMRQDDFEYTPEFKLLIAGNHRPQMRSVDEAMKRRMHIVPFTITIPEAERDQRLQAALQQEWPQILNWMIDGCLAWHEVRLAPPETIRTATETYLSSNDVLGAWIDDACEDTDADAGCSSKTLYKSFEAWCNDQGESPWKRRTWADAMVDRGYPTGRPGRERGFMGIKVRFAASQSHSNYSDT